MCDEKVVPNYQNSTDKNSVPASVADAPSQQQTSPIFRLTVDCCDEIFEYLSLKDLHAFGHTCKAMQKVAGEYFKLNYSTVESITRDDILCTVYDEKGDRQDRSDLRETDVRIETMGFKQIITSISNYYDYGSYLLYYISENINEFPLINHINILGFNFADERVDFFRNLLNKVEIIQIQNCTADGDFYDLFLKFCGNVRRLYIQDCDVGSYDSEDDDIEENLWLLRKYPTLEHIELRPDSIMEVRPELNEFFELNPNVRSFSTTADCIWANRNELLQSNAKLDILEVKIFTPAMYFNLDFGTEQIIEMIRNLFVQLFNRGFYKRLFLYVPKVDQQACNLLTLLKGLEKLCIREYGQIFGLAQLTNLRELAILDGAKADDMEILANSYTNLQRFYISNASIDDIRPFICRSTNLTKVKVIPKDESHFNGGILPLIALNREREKLAGARKVTIYVPDNVFINSKWATRDGDVNLKMIELKRAYSYEWNHHFS